MIVWQVLWLAVPIFLAGAVHMVVVKQDRLSALRVPLDGGRSWRGQRLFGDNKTWRGFAIMIPGCILLFALQQLLHHQFPGLAWLACFDYRAANPLWVGTWMAMGYLLGELPNSFIKRQAGIEPGITVPGLRGTLFSLLDQTDSVLGFLIFMPLYWLPSMGQALAILLVGMALHVGFNVFFLALGVRKRF